MGFFVHKDTVPHLVESLKKRPQVNYHIIDNRGFYDETNADRYSPIAVTWGVFPSREISQPTVVDPISFNFWKDEAFSLWQEQWQSLYEKDSRSYDVIRDITENLNLVDNDFVKGNCLFEVIHDVIKMRNECTVVDSDALLVREGSGTANELNIKPIVLSPQHKRLLSTV